MDMDNTSKGIAWVGTIYRKLEAMYLEVDDIMRQEGYQYVENQLQTVGVNVKQFCSDFMREVLPKSSVDTVEGKPDDSSLGQNIDEANIDEDHFEKELHSGSGEAVKIEQCDLSLEDTVNAAGIKENHHEEKQTQHELSEGVTPDKKDPSLPVLCPTSHNLLDSNSCTKINPTDVPSSDSVNLVHSCEGEVVDIELSSADASAESIRKSHNSIDDITDMGSSHKLKLDESCIIVDRSELSSLSHEAGRHRSYKKKFKMALTAKRRAAKKGHDQHAGWYRSPDLGSCQQKGEGSASSNVAVSNHEFCESDWEII